MKNELLIFENPEFGRVRTMEIDGEPYFVGKDVAEILGYANPSKAILNHVDEEDKQFVMLDIANTQNGNVPMGQTKTAFINESGLYSLIFSSKMSKAKEFKHWVTGEVLPSIRKTGKYEINEETYMPTRALTTEDYMDAARTISKCPCSRLALVLGMYRMAGFSIPEIRKAEGLKGSDEYISREDFTDLINQYSDRELMDKLNLNRVTIWRWKSGQYRPREPRLHKIVDTLRNTAEM